MNCKMIVMALVTMAVTAVSAEEVSPDLDVNTLRAAVEKAHAKGTAMHVELSQLRLKMLNLFQAGKTNNAEYAAVQAACERLREKLEQTLLDENNLTLAVRNAERRADLPLPQGYRFGDVFTNAIGGTVAVSMTNWPSFHCGFNDQFIQGGRLVPFSGGWLGFAGGCFRLDKQGRVNGLAAFTETEGVESIETLKNWAVSFINTQPNLKYLDFMKVHLFCWSTEEMDYGCSGFISSWVKDVETSVDVRRTKDGKAMLRLTVEPYEKK